MCPLVTPSEVEGQRATCRSRLWSQTIDVRTYYVYLIRCFDGTFYTGVTNDIERRFAEHCDGVNPACYTHGRRPLRLVYVGEFDRPSEAIGFEKRLKTWSHKKKRAFADRDWPLLKRLAVPHAIGAPSAVTPSNVEGQPRA